MKTLFRVTVFLIVLIIGAFAGYWYAIQLSEARSLAFDMAEANYYSSFMTIQMKEGTDATREEAIRGHLALIKKRNEHTNVLLTPKIAATDSALAYARLAALARKRGDNQEAQQLLSRAVSFCSQMGWSECSAEKITSIVQQLDKQGIFGVKSAE